MFWLDPDHRNGKTSPKLIDEYVQWAKEINCNFIRLSTLDELLDSRAGVLFKRKGFKPIETAYIKEV
jgi:GNAT superfamily N-acetyltransferase